MSQKPLSKKASEGKVVKESKDNDPKEQENPWKYCDQLPTLMEADKLCKKDMVKLCCREHYCVKTVRYLSELDKDNDIYRFYGALVGQDNQFMRRWLQVFAATNKKYVMELAKPYFKSIKIKYAKWVSDVRSNGRADVPALFLLSKITKVHSVVHINKNCYWSTLQEEPERHDNFMQRCNVHLAYLGRGIYA